MSVRIIKQSKESTIGEPFSSSPVLIESTLLLMPDQSQTQISSSEAQPFSTSTIINDYEHSSSTYRRGPIHRVPVPVHNASQWFSGPNMQNERSGRMEKVVSSLVRRSFRPMSNYAYVKLN
jgi:hypothetical protein